METVETLCICCGAKSEVIKKNRDFDKIVSLSDLKCRLPLSLERCPSCGFVSPSLTEFKSLEIFSLVGSEEYQTALNYKLTKKFDSDDLYEYLETNINLYDAYALICRDSKLDQEESKARYLSMETGAALMSLYYEKFSETGYEIYLEIAETLQENAEKDAYASLEHLKNPKKAELEIVKFGVLCFLKKVDEAKAILNSLGKEIDEELKALLIQKLSFAEVPVWNTKS